MTLHPDEPRSDNPNTACWPRLGIILDTYPRVSEQFVQREIADLAAAGASPVIAAFHAPERPSAGVPEVPVFYRPTPFSAAFWRVVWPDLRSILFWTTAVGVCVEACARRDRGERVQSRPGDGGEESGKRTSAPFWLWHALPTSAWIAGLFREARVEHIHAHFAGVPAATGRIVSRLLAIPYSLSLHGSDLYRQDSLFDGNVREARFVLACTRQNVARLKARFPAQRVLLLRHALDLDRFSPPRGHPVQETPPLILSVARLVPKKGLDRLIAACARLKHWGIRFRVEIIGDGPERQALRRQVADAGLDRGITFRGAQPEEEVLAAMRRATLFVLPCRETDEGEADGVPNVILEAMACGVPVITRGVGAIREVVEHGTTGWLCDESGDGTVEGLAHSIQRLLSSPEERGFLARGARRLVEREFDRKRGETTCTFFSEIIAARCDRSGTQEQRNTLGQRCHRADHGA